MTKIRFKAKLQPAGRGGGGHLVAIPAKILSRLGGTGRIPVTATFNGIPYRGTIANMGAGPCLGVRKAIIAEAEVAVGDTLDVTLERDLEERTVTVPPDLARALASNRAARQAWDNLSYTHKKEHARALEDAKKPETRTRRLARTIALLTAST
jgi:hypothetical protein